VSLTGSAMTFVALPWFVLVTTGSTAEMGGMRVVFLAIAAGFTAGAIAFSAAVRRGDTGEEEADALPAADLATVPPAEVRADWIST